MKKYIVEFIGTFFFVLTILVVSNNGTPAGFAPIAVGFALIAMTFAGKHISGAHYNPALTVAMLMRKNITLNDGLGYILAQFIAAVFAAFTAKSLLEGVTAIDKIDTPMALTAEFLGTFALVYVFFNAVTVKENDENSFYGLAIGAIFIAITYGLGSVSGGAFNPAVAIGLSTAGAFDWVNLWIYLVGSLAGAGVAAILYGFLITPEIS
jgi:aquaporin Z